MESFLKDRPVHSTSAAGERSEPLSGGIADAPFAPIQRSGSATVASRFPAASEIEAGRSADGASVRAVMENGRITRLVVTCSCGKVTEIACAY